jgi:predicted RNA polymerase sigma factor
VTVALIQPTIALAAGQPAEALAAIDRLLDDMAYYGFTSQHGEAYRLRGDALRQLGREDEARAAYTTALEVATQQGATRSVAAARDALRTTNDERRTRPTTNN